MKTLVVLILLALTSVGCSIEVENTDLISAPSTSTSNPLGIKFSGGANESDGTTLDAEFSIGPRNRGLSGTTVDADFSISSNRPSL